MFAVSENIAMFVMPNTDKTTKSDCYIRFRNHKAGFLRQFYFGSLAVFGDIQGRLASFVTYLPNFFLTMPNTGKVSGAVNNSTRTASTKQSTQYSLLKSKESTYKVAVFGYVFSGNQGFGHCISYIVSAPSEASAIARATRKYSRRPNALSILEVRIIHPANSTCLTYSGDER